MDKIFVDASQRAQIRFDDDGTTIWFLTLDEAVRGFQGMTEDQVENTSIICDEGVFKLGEISRLHRR